MTTEAAALYAFAELALADRIELTAGVMMAALLADSAKPDITPMLAHLLGARARGWRVYFTLTPLPPSAWPRQTIVVVTDEWTANVVSDGRFAMHEHVALALDCLSLREGLMTPWSRIA